MVTHSIWNDIGFWLFIIGALLVVLAIAAGIASGLVLLFTKKKINPILLKGLLIAFSLGMLAFLVGMGICGWFIA